MPSLSRQKPLFLCLSAVSISSLIGSFGFPLQQLEVWKQAEISSFNTPVIRTFILTENDKNFPFGFDPTSAKKYAQVHETYFVQKILLLATAIGCSVAALLIGKDLVPLAEYEDEAKRLKHEGQKELTFKGIKQRFALASKSQQLLFLDEIKTLMQEFGSPEEEILEADELNALYDQAEANQLPQEETEQPSKEADFRATFPESMDATSWKAVLKAVGNGASRDEVIKEVLGCGAHNAKVGSLYLDYLKQKFMI